MAFSDENWEKLLPSYLRDEGKGRLSEALDQFKPENRNNKISYQDFYYNYGYSFFLQGDLVNEIRCPIWNKEKKEYNKIYPNAIILSNSCDISFENKRDLNPKQCLFAPLISLEEYIDELIKNGFDKAKLDTFMLNIKSQAFSNIFYLPENEIDKTEYIALFDKIYWYPIDELKKLTEQIREDRIISLNQYGFYLFILKLSYHLCRLPEACDREIIIPS